MLTVESTKRNFKIFILASVLRTRSLPLLRVLLRATLALFATLAAHQIADDWGRPSLSGAGHYSDDEPLSSITTLSQTAQFAA